MSGEKQVEQRQPLADEARNLATRLQLATRAAGLGTWEFDLAAGVADWDERMFAIYGLVPTAPKVDFADWRALVLPEDLLRVDRALAVSLETGEDFRERFRIRRGGEIRMVRALGLVIRDAAGKPVRMIGVNEDVTELWRAEEQLRTLSQAVEQSGTAIVVTDREGIIEYVNPACCESCGYSREMLVGASPRIFRSGETPVETYRQMWETILSGRTWRGELNNRRRDGSVFPEAVTISPVRDPQAGITHFVAIKQDLSGKRDAERLRRELDARTAKLERMEILGTIAGGIAHDFNNILVAILGFAELAGNGLREGQDRHRLLGYVEEIGIGGERARGIVRQLLAFSRGGQVRPEPVAVAAAIAEVASAVGPTLAAGQRLELDVAADLPVLLVDPAHLRHVLLNVCANAREALGGDGTIRISAARIVIEGSEVCDSCHREFWGEFIEIRIADSGSGMAESVREHAFEPFFTTREVRPGVGMGLAVVHGLVHRYLGHLKLRSVVGKGTEVLICLPDPAAGAPEAAEVPEAGTEVGDD